MRHIVITGHKSGLGKLIYDLFAFNRSERTWQVTGWSLPEVDIRDNDSVEAAVKRLLNPRVDVLINCAGVNLINFIPDVTEMEWNKVIDTNVKGIFNTTKALLSHMDGGTIINIVSNASHIPMTSSIAYNASKGAAAIMTKQMARELKKTHDITVFGISPNKLKNTGMSEYIDNKVMELRGWTKEQATAYQVAALPAGEETDPQQLAEFIGYLLTSKNHHKYLNGCDIPYGA